MLIEDFFKIAKKHFNDALPFVLYRKPNATNVKGLFQKENTIYTSESLTEKGFVFAPFNSKEQTILIPLDKSEIFDVKYKEFESISPNQSVAQNINEAFTIEAKLFHKGIVSKAIEMIEHNGLQKVVITRKEIVNLSQTNPIQLFLRLLQNYPTAFVYCWYHPKIGLWLGATPETLISITGNRLNTMALAGTQKYEGDDNVIWQPKETKEQELVTNFIVDNLKYLVNNLTIGATKTIKAGNLLHLKTAISGILDANLKIVVEALHPTPAVCGLPKELAKQFILNNENYNREYYTGFLGELNIKEVTTRNSNRRNVENNIYTSVKKVSNLYVNLRCMQLKDSKANIYVGGGITEKSNPEKEWEETVNKAQTMKKVLF